MPPFDPQKATISDIKQHLDGLASVGDALLDALDADARRGVRALALRERRRRKSAMAERARLEKMLLLEKRLHARGAKLIAGVDEAGRGPLAGPVVAAAVVLPEGPDLPGVNDSKALSSDRREALFESIQERAEACAVGQASVEEIDQLNILQATLLAMRRALQRLGLRPDRVLVDGTHLPESPYAELAVVDGDATSLSIAAASILAKVTRDRQMIEYDAQYPEYGFARHKGYGSSEHIAALREHGPCPIHRRSFATVSELATGFSDDYEMFAEGIDRARGLGELRAIGESIAKARSALDPREVEALRERYWIRQAALGRPGRRGEQIAANHLRKAGYEILCRNFRAVGGEIDLIAKRRDVLALVEVKTATSSRFAPPEDWVTPDKQRQVIRVAEAYLHRNPLQDVTPRFDVVVIRLSEDGQSLRHIEGAFRKGDGA
ncbi:MAG: ribonuclease HII [Candidatus Latescibacteria bacterium]|jgi:ribonuclease HII|nr:ribonuclease HII [Candidatus Latescibacterota bacterium]